jgi:hypothetical protein
MSSTQSLPAVVEALEDKAKKHRQAENTQYHVSVAEHNIREVNTELNKLISKLQDLKYYKTVLEEAFDGEPPTMLDSTVKDGKKIAKVNQVDLLQYVQSGEMTGEVDLEAGSQQGQPIVERTPDVRKHISTTERVNKQLENVNDQLVRDLKKEREEWSTKIEAAEQLQKIIGAGSSDFATTLNQMHRLLTQKLLKTEGGAQNFVVQWERSVGEWEEHQSLQSLDDFQRKHGLSDATIDDVERLSKSRKLTLADVSVDTLEEMKEVDELASAVSLNL